jgi:hypothetical protein
VRNFHVSVTDEVRSLLQVETSEQLLCAGNSLIFEHYTPTMFAVNQAVYFFFAGAVTLNIKCTMSPSCIT